MAGESPYATTVASDAIDQIERQWLRWGRLMGVTSIFAHGTTRDAKAQERCCGDGRAWEEVGGRGRRRSLVAVGRNEVRA
jgi:hypothetical protein